MLRLIAFRKIYVFLIECRTIFFNKTCFYYDSEARSAAMEQSLKKLGVEPLGKEDVQKMPWESLEAKIGNWIHFMRIAV